MFVLRARPTMPVSPTDRWRPRRSSWTRPWSRPGPAPEARKTPEVRTATPFHEFDFSTRFSFFLVRVWPARLFLRAPGRVRPRHKFRRAPLGPRVVRLRETHALIERRMIVEPNLHGGRRLRLLESHFAEVFKWWRRNPL